MKKQYRFLGDRGEISGHAVFESGSKGAVVEIDQAVADAAIAEGFPLEAVEAVKETAGTSGKDEN